MTSRLLALLLACSASASFATASLAADLYTVAPAAVEIESHVPSCGDPRVLAEVESQFTHGAKNMLKSDVAIVEFSQLHEKAFFPLTETQSIERRYCQGAALMSSEVNPRTLYYVIEYPMGFASISWKAEGCILGYDRWHIYGANCETLRRF